MKIFIANFIFILHIIFIIFMVYAPFSNNMKLISLHILTCPMLIAHWKLNNDTCGLTIIEQKLRGVEKNETFFQNLIGYVYKYNRHTDIPVLKITIVLWTVSIIYLIKEIYNNYDYYKSFFYKIYKTIIN